MCSEVNSPHPKAQPPRSAQQIIAELLTPRVIGKAAKIRDKLTFYQSCLTCGGLTPYGRREVRRKIAELESALARLTPHRPPSSTAHSIHRGQHRRTHRGKSTDPDDEADDPPDDYPTLDLVKVLL